jgi:plastocyanin
VSEERVAALEGDVQSLNASDGKVAEPTTTRHFYITGVEWKGTTSADKLSPPTIDPKDLSDGYGFNDVGFDEANPLNWRVATYVWSPASMIAFEGDRIDLTIFILNGNEHTTWIEGADGTEVVSDIEMNRGREYKISFIAGEPGTYILHCDDHDPTMTAYIQVLPRA